MNLILLLVFVVGITGVILAFSMANQTFTKGAEDYDLTDYNCSQILSSINDSSCLYKNYRPNGFFSFCYNLDEKIGYYLVNCCGDEK